MQLINLQKMTYFAPDNSGRGYSPYASNSEGKLYPVLLDGGELLEAPRRYCRLEVPSNPSSDQNHQKTAVSAY